MLRSRFLPERLYPNIKPDKLGWVNADTNEVIIARTGLVENVAEFIPKPFVDGEIYVSPDIDIDLLGVKSIKSLIADGAIAVNDNDVARLINFDVSQWVTTNNTATLRIDHNLNTTNLDVIIKNEVGRIVNMEYTTPSNNYIELVIFDAPKAKFSGSVYIVKII